jgi:ABC-type enterochelin transport system ATPase subunit
MTSKADIIRNWYQTIWMKGETDRVYEFMVKNAEANGILNDAAINPDDLENLVTMMRGAANNIVFDVPIIVVQDEWLAAVVTVECFALSNGNLVKASGHVMARFEGDKMVEVYNSFDFLSFFEQTGQLPDSSLALLLSGMTFE